MTTVNNIFAAVFEALVALPRALGWGPYGECVFVSLLLGVVFLWIFKLTTNQEKIREATRRLFAHLIETRLFDHEPRVVLRSFLQLLRWNLRYFVLSLRPAFILTIPMVLLLTQMEASWGTRPLRPGESTTVTVTLRDFETYADALRLKSTNNVVVESPAMRSPATRQVSWRVRGLRTGRAFVTVHADKLRFRKSIDVTAQHAPRVSRTRSQQLADQFYYPVEAGLAPDGPIVAIAAAYPSRLLRWGPVSLHWIWWLLLWSIAPAFVIRWLVNRWRPNTL
ncbi:MAG: hypothetical protein H6713_41130 [Myxococcales bacterium]|nr:hypothetical protein [Myxococcales bacterium]MCB9756366.1 hypothetical protein [Myxococcales bacterium]